jgi:hypothetical protein
MLAAFLERNDSPASVMPFGKDPIVSGNDLSQHLRRDSDFTVRIGRADENNPVPYFTVWRFLCKVAVHAVSPLLPHVPEQLEIRENPENKSKPLIRLNVPLLPTVAFSRLAVAVAA